MQHSTLPVTKTANCGYVVEAGDGAAQLRQHAAACLALNFSKALLPCYWNYKEYCPMKLHAHNAAAGVNGRN